VFTVVSTENLHVLSAQNVELINVKRGGMNIVTNGLQGLTDSKFCPQSLLTSAMFR
jgi:hypothetical protein